jgi:hypothetical protein
LDQISAARSRMADITHRIAQRLSSSSAPRLGNSRGWALRLAEELHGRYGLPREWLFDRANALLDSLSLPEDALRELHELILKRCELSLEIAKLKAEEATELPKDAGELEEFVRRRDIEEGLISEVLGTIDRSQCAGEAARIKALLEFLFEVSRKLQAIYLSGSGGAGR